MFSRASGVLWDSLEGNQPAVSGSGPCEPDRAVAADVPISRILRCSPVPAPGASGICPGYRLTHDLGQPRCALASSAAASAGSGRTRGR